MLLWEAAAAHHPKDWPDGNVSVLQVNFWKPEQAAVSMPQVRGKKNAFISKKQTAEHLCNATSVCGAWRHLRSHPRQLRGDGRAVNELVQQEILLSGQNQTLG